MSGQLSGIKNATERFVLSHAVTSLDNMLVGAAIMGAGIDFAQAMAYLLGYLFVVEKK